MANNNTTFELRSEEIQDILTRVPHWMIRWGTVLIFAIILMLCFVSWFVKYPDIVSTEIVITTSIPPEKLVARTSGRIETILVQDKSIVQENTPLAIIQNTADYKNVFLLKSILQDHSEGNEFDFEKLKNVQLGDIESAFALFHSAYIANELNKNLQPFQVEKNAQNSENTQIRERLNLLQQQKTINESELQLQKSNVNRYEILFDKGVISAQDFESKKLGYLQAEKGYKNLLSSISQLKSSLIENERTVRSACIHTNF